jgi:phosphoribosylformylglycinamidine (FGAM) synthase PurS component
MALIEVAKKKHVADAEGEDARSTLTDAGLDVRSVQVHQLYFIEGKLDRKSLLRLADELLTDPVIETAAVSTATLPKASPERGWDIIRTFHSGVTDNTGETTLNAAHAMGFGRVTAITTGKRFLIQGSLSAAQARMAAEKILANPVIETVTVRRCSR